MAGRGSVENRGKNRWRLRYSGGFDKRGKRIRRSKTVTAKNSTEARKILAAYVTDIEAGTYVQPSKMKFKQFVKEEWKKKYAEKHLSDKTLEHHDYILDTMILPEFESMLIGEIQAIHVLNFLDSLEKDGIRKDGKKGGYSPSTINHNYQLLKDIFDRAKEWKFIRTSPMDGVKRPKVIYKKFKIYNDKQAAVLFKKLQDEPQHWRLFFTLALTCGMRRGELLGLQISRINFDKNTIYIDHQLRYTKEKGYQLIKPKADSIRTVSVSTYVMEDLKDYIEKKQKEQEQKGELWRGGNWDLVFSTWNGKPFHVDAPRKWWKRFSDRAEIPYIRPHDFRHTSASMLINRGVHAKIISQRLGHADIRTTMNIYGHVYDHADVAAAGEFDTFFIQNGNNDDPNPEDE